MELEDTVGGVLPTLQDFSARFGFELLTIENSADEGDTVVEAITTSIIARFDAPR